MPKRSRKHLSAASLLSSTRESFSYIKDPLQKKTSFSLVDCLMSGLAIFGQKFPSLLQFDQSRDDETIRHNLKTLY